MKDIQCKSIVTVLMLLVMSIFGVETRAASSKPEIEVSGTVIDDKGEPVMGATVLVVNSKEGTSTNLDGEFVVKAPGDGRLKISYIGYQSVEVPVNGQRTLKVMLKESTTSLDEVVVVGYGTMKRKEMTSAISHISAKDLNQISSLDASMLLQGKVSSVSVSNTALADPNSTGSIQIRGISSRNAGLGPLIVIDGVPGGDMTNVNPADIESIDVLKDGAASAIYGTRGSNGVILVNLKKGTRDGNTHTTYSASLTLNKAKKELDIMNAEEYRAYRTVSNPLSDMGASTDWFDSVTRLGVTQMHTLTFSGGNAKTNYRVTADYRDARGIDLRSDRKEYGARATVTHTTQSGLFTFMGNITPRVINRNKSADVYGNVIKNNPTMPVYDSESADGYYRFPSGGDSFNIVEQLNMETNSTEMKLLEWNATATINLLPLFNPEDTHTMLKSQVTIAQYQVDKFGGTYTPSTYGPNVNAGITGQAGRSYDQSTQNNLDWVTNFSTYFGDHRVRAMVGYSYNYGVASGMAANNQNFTSDGLTFNNLGAGLEAAKDGKVQMSSYKNDHKLISFFGRVNYDWKERYLLSASLRHEGSSRFGQNHKWGNFPAVSVGWRISDEPFMHNVTWLDDLKFRYDYGVTGNQNIGNYQSLATYKAFGWYQYAGNNFHVWGPGKNVNPDLRWEKGHNQNIGLDFSIFNHMIDGSLNYFNRRQTDLLGEYSVAVPPNLFTDIYANVGTLRNTGFEFDITVNAVKTRDFNYSFTVVGSTNNNKFESFSNDLYKGKKYYSTCNMDNPNNPGYLQRIEEGQRIGNYFTYRYAGVDKQGDWLIYDKKGNVIPVAQGEEEDKTVTGNGLPKFTGSMTHNFNYRNFDLTIALRGAAGFDIFNVHDFYFGLQSMSTNQLTTAYSKNAHITTGKNVITDYFIERGDYIKLDNVTLGYTLPLNRKYIDKVRMFATGSNLYTVTRFSGIDPSTYEVNGLTPGTFGGSYKYYPSAFQFIFGMQVNF